MGENAEEESFEAGYPKLVCVEFPPESVYISPDIPHIRRRQNG